VSLLDGQPNCLTSVDLFAGAGGLALGIESAGFKSHGLVEFNKHACTTLRLNADSLNLNTGWPVYEADARAFDYTRLGTDVDLLAGGAPCQPFSLGGKHLGNGDERNMFPEVFQAVRALQPKVVLLENVRGLARQSFRPYFNYILAQLALPYIPPNTDESWFDHFQRLQRADHLAHSSPDHRYDARWKVLNSADYGVPQNRQRVFIVAFRRDLEIEWNFPSGTHSENRLIFDQYVSGEYWDRNGMEPKPPGDRLRTRIQRLHHDDVPRDCAWKTLREAIAGLPEPVEGIESSGPTFHTGIRGAKLYKGHTGNDLDKPSKTIKAGDHGNPGGEHIILRDDGSIRYMTVRECARVQAFPDDYLFSGTRSEAMRQIGNAVPVALAESIAMSIHRALTGKACVPSDTWLLTGTGSD
jgi:DNA (cytosine-5)-methyltransferase 1